MKTLFPAEAISKGGRSGSVVQRVMEEAHKICPYSKALGADTSTNLAAEEGPTNPKRTARTLFPNEK